MYYSRNKFFVNIFLKNVKISSGLPQTKRQLCTAAYIIEKSLKTIAKAIV
jgi:hypothetical protein